MYSYKVCKICWKNINDEDNGLYLHIEEEHKHELIKIIMEYWEREEQA